MIHADTGSNIIPGESCVFPGWISSKFTGQVKSWDLNRMETIFQAKNPAAFYSWVQLL